jgi:hypothetical protein
MKWTIRIEFTPDGSAWRSREVGLLTREELRDENIGLTLEGSSPAPEPRDGDHLESGGLLRGTSQAMHEL